MNVIENIVTKFENSIVFWCQTGEIIFWLIIVIVKVDMVSLYSYVHFGSSELKGTIKYFTNYKL